ncbi:SDR family NAD(P)-dependent oxidoreductase [Flavobacterium sp. Fl-318]|uniref:SDR family NAD(P)-dependent oxidoreductase n=1 Tax=Flavobacterium cupriresistens TaxID=2893885 RepID=A0ABU4RGB4_9FLAO|nr:MULTISPECIES: SDR family NAD(P)-dependent oxidoreductase [unclassified Flavobacterium]MDX6191629.1 SDR family NAD(P)-dependent oxidoreductase [Flavobacterium sp. Fl-318]UFH41574.1 SDR family NAD(P)-dependent oxidoreductase [Flavobacterium sp. F-323]
MTTIKNNAIEMQRICHNSLLSILINMGFRSGIANDIDLLKIELKIVDKHTRLLEECIRSLKSCDYLQENEAVFTLTTRAQEELKDFDRQVTLQNIFAEMPEMAGHAKLLQGCLDGLQSIFQGKINATDVMFPDGSMELVSGVYKGNEQADYFNDILCQVVENIVADNIENLGEGEKFTILEVGAGTGGTSNLLFQVLSAYKDKISYVYTDLSKSFLFHAEKHYKAIAPYLETKLFNIERSPENQELALGSFDMVIGANVVHATKNIRKSLQNIKGVLKRNGVLVLNEIAQNDIYATLTFGLLDGWWLYEDAEVRLGGSPGLSPKGWQKVLTDTGFVNTMSYPEDEELFQQIIISQSDGEIILADEDAKVEQSLKDTKPDKKEIVSQKAVGIAQAVDSKEIANFIKNKLALVLKMEISEFDEITPMSDYGVDSIIGLELIKEINETLTNAIPTTILFDYPTIKEFAKYLAEEHSSAFTIQPTVSENEIKPEKEVLSQQLETVKKEETPFSVNKEKGQAQRLWLEKPATIDDISIVNFDLPAIQQEEVLVEISHFSLNFGDLLCVKGLYPTMPPYPFSPGFEASGIIIERGDKVINFSIGDRVIVMTDGSYGLHSTHCVANELQLLPIPENQSFEEACAIPTVAMTMVEAFRRVHVKKGDYILVQTATGGIGHIAIQLAKHLELKVIATAGSTHKIEYLREIGVTHAINYREQDFEEAVNRITNGQGVTVVVNTLSGENIQKGINCLGKRGQYIELSMTALKSANHIDLSKFSNNQTFIAVDLRKLIGEDREYIEGLWAECKQYIEKGILKSVISTEVPFEDYKKAYKILEDRDNIGKVIVKANSVRTTQTEIPSSSFKEIKQSSQNTKALDIAIVGMSGQYGSAKDLNDFWQKIKGGESLIEEVPNERWNIDEHFSADQEVANKTYSKWGSFLRDIDKFDPLFFRISGKEAEGMDPQQRLFLEHCWKAFEDAAIVTDKLNGAKCGIYVGAGQGDYVQTTNLENAAIYWGNSSAILASRISYFLNLKGPAIAIDTACSSSLVAIEMACKSLYYKEVDIALSGGVFINTTPRFYKLSSKAGMLSKDGQCYAFDHRANGFVPGEGVGVLVLKRLEDAKRDGDYIHGIIKGVETNQDGTTNGILAPSMKSQEELENEVYQKYDIHPESITYVEAHGTGTALGDPIEFEGLTRAFKKQTTNTNYCGLGSVKTNIGHTVYAAGVAGVQKVLLALQEKIIPPTINYEAKNSLINLENSPFYITDKIQDWTSSAGTPRRAAVSSFGFSGTNAHLVVEEYENKHQKNSSSKEFVIPISAKSEKALERQIINLIDYLEQKPGISISDVAYTWQVGRQPMEFRSVFIADSIADFVSKLKNNKGLVSSNAISAKEKEQFKTFLSNGAGEAYIKYATEHNEYQSLANLWAMGVTVDWNKLYRNNKERPQRISLPTYAFEKERYWLKSNTIIESNSAVQKLHPLLHQRINVAEGNQKFNSIYLGEEHFFRDHIFRNEKILPGVAYLEIAKTAGEKCIEKSITQFKNVLWLQPIWHRDKTIEIETEIIKQGDSLQYVIYSTIATAGVSGQEKQIHGQGELTSTETSAPVKHDIEKIKKSLSKNISRDTFYEKYQEIGLELGASFRGVQHLWFSSSEAISKIELPKGEGYALTPGIMDSALQTCIGINLEKEVTGLLFPFSVEQIDICQPLEENIWSYVRKSKNNKSDEVINYDVDICNQNGEVLIAFQNVLFLPERKTAPQTIPTEEIQLYKAVWKETPISSKRNVEVKRKIIICEAVPEMVPHFNEFLNADIEMIEAASPEVYFEKTIAIIKQVITSKENVEVILVYPINKQLEIEFLSALLKTASLENSKIMTKMIGVAIAFTASNSDALYKIIGNELETTDQEIKYAKGNRNSKQLELVRLSNSKEKTAIKSNGLYVITGGMGSLGRIFATYITNKKAKVILLGRKKLNKSQTDFVESLPNATYMICDIINRQKVQNAVSKIKKEYGQINGIIHTAGITRDSLIQLKTEEEAKSVFAPKMEGVKNLDEVCKNEPLDFMMLFSSIVSELGNIGQSDYTAANAYLNNYALYREQERLLGNRKGKTYSIGWGFWQDGGMRLQEEQIGYLDTQWGMKPMPTDSGLELFETILATASQNLLVAYGDSKRMSTIITNRLVEKKKVENLVEQNSKNIKEKLLDKLHLLIADLLKLDKDRIDRDKDLAVYGVDSILLTELNSELNAYYEIALLPSVFYNNTTIESLAEHLLEEYNLEVHTKHQDSKEDFLEEDSANKNNLSNAKTKEHSLSQLDVSKLQSTIEGSSYLIQFHKIAPEKTSIFIIPGVPGIAYGYYEVAEQFSTYGNCYGITMQGIFDNKKPLDSIAKMAAHNVAEIAKITPPNSEIHLVTHSFGGLISYEMVKQLQLLDIEVKQIFMLDCFPNTLSSNEMEKTVLFLNLFPEIFDKVEIEALKSKVYSILQEKNADRKELLYNFITTNGVTVNQNMFDKLWDVFDVSMSCSYEMDIQHQVPITLAKVKDKVITNEVYDLGWSQYFEEVEVIEVEGDHFSIIREPYCSKWVKEITFYKEKNEQVSLTR